MKITFEWLKDHLNTNLKEEKLLEQLTNIGLEGLHYFRVALVSKPLIEKLIKALEDFSNKELFPNK